MVEKLVLKEAMLRTIHASNGRLGLWKSGFELFKTNVLFGTSPKGIFEYAKEVLPTTFIARTQKYTHNTYVNVITSTGLVGSFSTIFILYKKFLYGYYKSLWKS
ncbi:O-antigen ligase family protein [Enterococcus avium]